MRCDANNVRVCSVLWPDYSAEVEKEICTYTYVRTNISCNFRSRGFGFCWCDGMDGVDVLCMYVQYTLTAIPPPLRKEVHIGGHHMTVPIQTPGY